MSTYMYKMAFKCLKTVLAGLVWDQQPVNAHLEGCQWVTVELAGSLGEEVSGGHCGKNISSLGLDDHLAAHRLWQAAVYKDWIRTKPHWQWDGTSQWCDI